MTQAAILSAPIPPLERALALCGSPIEQRMLRALVEDPHFIDHGFLVTGVGMAPEGTVLTLEPQADVLGYRVDFLIGARGWRSNLDMTIVECDGHDFHEKTKAQAVRDKQRDRRLQAAGYRVLRFTGSEIHIGPQHCADQVWTIVARAAGWRHEGAR